MSRIGPRGLAAAAAIGILVVLVAIIVLPLAWVVTAGIVAVTRAPAVFAAAPLLRAVLGSLAVAAVTTTLTLGLAVPVAYGLARTNLPGRRFVVVILGVPAVWPPFVAGLGLALLLGRDGIVARALGPGWSIEGFIGIVVSQVLTLLPPACLVIATALTRVGVDLDEAAENLGAAPLTIARRITMAVARSGVVVAALVVFAVSLGDLANPLVIAGDFPVLTTAIYARAVRGGDASTAAALAALLAIPCGVAYAFALSRPGWRSCIVGARIDASTVRVAPVGLRWSLSALAAIVAVSIVGVYGAIVAASVVPAGGSLGLDHYAWAAREAAGALLGSVAIASAAALTGAVLAVVIAYLAERVRPPGTVAITFLAVAAAALPGPVIGLGHRLVFGDWRLELAGAVSAVVASVVAWKLWIGVLVLRRRLRELPPAVEEVAVSLGAGATTTFVRIVLPLLGPALVATAIDLFVAGMLTVAAVAFLVSPALELGSVVALTAAGEAAHGRASALTVVLSVVAATALLVRRAVARGIMASIPDGEDPR